MAWDPAIALQGATTPIMPNPLEFFGGLQQLQKRQHDNLLFQQQNDARVAQGEAYKRALGENGALDEPKLIDILKTLPGGQFALPEALAAAQAREKERLAIQGQQLAVGKQRLTMFSDTIGGLLTKGDNVTEQDVYSAVSKLATQVGDPELAKTMFIGLKDMPKGGKDLSKWILQQNAALLSGAERLGMTNPPPEVVDTGAEKILRQTNRLSGGTTNLTSTENMPTPAERNTPEPDQPRAPDGTPQQRATAAQTRQLTGGKGTPANNMSMVPPARAAIGPAPAALATELSTTEDLNKYISGLHGQITTAEQNIKQIGSMRALLDSVRTGPLAEKRLAIGKVFQGLGFGNSVVEMITGGDLAKAEEFAKKSFDEAYMGLKAMTPPGTQLTNGEVMAKWQNSPRLDMNPQAIEDLFNYSVEVFQYKQQERDFLSKWRKDGEHPSEGQAAWTREAINKGLIKPEARDRGQGPGVLVPRAGIVRGAGVPSNANVSDDLLLKNIPDGESKRITLDSGGSVVVRRKGNTFSVEK